MDYKKTNAPLTTVTRDMIAMAEQTGNVYETVCIIGKRANQISADLKKELEKKLQEFASTDNNEEVSENREQIEISRFYEKLPKPTLIATQEYIEHKLYFSNPLKEKDHLNDWFPILSVATTSLILQLFLRFGSHLSQDVAESLEFR